MNLGRAHIRPVLATLSVALPLLGACTKEVDVVRDSVPAGDLTVRVSIDQVSTTRVVGRPIEDERTLDLVDGYMLFVDLSGRVTKVVAIVEGDSGYNSTTGSVGIEAIKHGWASITEIPSISVSLAFWGNKPTATAFERQSDPRVGDRVADYTVSVYSQWFGSSTTARQTATLWGEAPIEKIAANTSRSKDEYHATPVVTPVVSRIEIGAISGTHSTGRSLTYDIDGIFIDRYYNKIGLNGVAGESDFVSNGGDVTRYVEEYTGPTMPGTGRVHDYRTAAQGLTNPTDGNVWGYYLLAPSAVKAPSTHTIAMPAIIIKLSNVKVDGKEWPGTHFLTLTKFREKKSSGSKVDIARLEQGRVYQIARIAFSELNLTPAPYMTTHDAMVEVNPMNWEIEELGWDL